ncbi:MerR family transcriptional regulator [Candidatus Avoscillospira sp. LCP25S3_F1]|uniref:MerR family transcriptional regulator n=1 Tax=Candidatus Avoscillospira sp. LCP25S3_F1 TaxID=3438825 RepID=UPI003F8F64B6
MNAKQAEQCTGISRRNLRFYEQQGLIHPARNPDNDYRDYSQQDLEALKLIRALRMLDTPLEDIAACLRGETTVADLAAAQAIRLQQRRKELEMSIGFCRQLQSAATVDAAFVDRLLRQMDTPETRRSLFQDWKADYRKVAAADRRRSFAFTPDDNIATAADFTNVLCAYANDHGLNLVITKEGLEPEFTIDGIPYRAMRLHRRMGPAPVMTVRCVAQTPEALEPDVPQGRKRLLRLLRNSWPLLFLAFFWLPRVASAEPANRWEVLLAGLLLAVSVGTLYWFYLRNYRE